LEISMSLQGFNPDPDAPVMIDTMIPSERQISMGGNWARRLLDNELDVGCMRPYVSDDGARSYITRNQMQYDPKQKKHILVPKAVRTWNDTNATLRVLDWIQLDEAIVRTAKPRLRAAKDLREAGLVYMLPNGIAKTTMQFQQQSDISGATISMDGLRQGESDRPVFSLINFPLPIIHKDFQYPLRQVLASRTGYSPLDTTTAELAGRRVAEQVEQLTLGCSADANYTAPGQLLGQSSYTWNSATIYGYMNYPSRITYSITQPTSAGWIPQNTVDDILNMKRLSQQAFHTGPWMLYFGLGWDPYMDDDYKPTYNDMTLRQRIRECDGILDARTVDYIPDMSLLMVQQTTDVVRMVIGMDITTVQWESHGGMQLNFKVMCVMVPQLRTDFYGNTGIVHGS
jgi:Family of unknown function (DUF6260)